MKDQTNFFQKAVPVWPGGLAGEKNVRVSFHAEVRKLRSRSMRLRIAGASAFRIWINGKFYSYGPARGPHGFARVDERIVPDSFFTNQESTEAVAIVVEMAHYGVATFCEVQGKAFCCAEILLGRTVVAWTGAKAGGFIAERRAEAIQKIERYSYQRAFCEGYRFDLAAPSWKQPGYRPAQPLKLSHVTPVPRWLQRGTDYPRFEILSPRDGSTFGRAPFHRKLAAGARQHRFLHSVPEISEGFLLSEVTWPLFETLAGLRFHATPGFHPSPLKKGSWMRVDFGQVQTGFPRFTVKTRGPARIVAIFDEILIGETIQFDRLECVNAFWLELQGQGEIEFEAFEPYTLRYLQIIVLQGVADVSGIGLRDLGSPVSLCAPAPGLSRPLRRVRDAALASFRQNSLDIYMDCPSRERAGWLCDSLFTARAEWHLCGDNQVERAFLENYLRPKKFRGLPTGMVPMCYPAEALEGVFIPNWAMFLILQLAEARRFRRLPTSWNPHIEHRVRGLLAYFRRFENDRGLLEDLESWVFVEWSEAQSFVKGVNFPTNMLYAAMLDAAAFLLGEKRSADKAESLRSQIRALAWRDGRYLDQATRTRTGLVLGREATEVCQYYAFSFGLDSPQDRPELWHQLLKENYRDLHPANAFIGKLLRLELLIEMGEHGAARREIAKSYAPMARQTGTLWEHLDTRASCNHGFTSYIACLIDQL